MGTHEHALDDRTHSPATRPNHASFKILPTIIWISFSQFLTVCSVRLTCVTWRRTS